jgi:hypothetical protein
VRQLIVIALDHPSYRHWCLQMRVPERAARYFSTHTNADKVRGLKAEDVAIVQVDNVALPEGHRIILDIYKMGGATEIARDDSSAVRKWIDADADDSRDAR